MIPTGCQVATGCRDECRSLHSIVVINQFNSELYILIQNEIYLLNLDFLCMLTGIGTSTIQGCKERHFRRCKGGASSESYRAGCIQR